MILDQSPLSITTTDLQGHLTYVNDAFEKITGFSRHQVLGKNPRFLYSGHHAPAFYQELWSRILSGKVWNGVFKNLKNDQSALWEEATISPFFDVKGSIEGFMAIKMDITEKRILQQQVIQSSKLSAIGTLASEIAHELNNPLSVVLGENRMMQEEGGLQAPSKQRVARISHAAQRMKKIIDRLRHFARQGQEGDHTVLDINQLIMQSLVLLEQQMKLSGIALELTLSPTSPWVNGMVDQLESVLQNIFTNAWHSFDTIADNRLKKIRVSSVLQEDHIIIEIEDNGIGMSESTRAKIFDPFFTTKGLGKGTGLGLSIVHQIVDKHRGSMVAKSKEEVGSTFTIFLPRSLEAPLPVPLPAGKSIRPIVTAKPTILVIDDEPEVAEIVRDFLGTAFITTIETNPLKAYDLMEQRVYDIILTDAKMPLCTAVDIIEKVKGCQPTTPVMVMSGYGPHDEEIIKIMAAGAVGYLSKPFADPDQLIQAIYACL